MTSIGRFLADVWNSHRGLICILSGGAVGGYASTILPATENQIASGVPSSLFLGALAAFLFVILASNTDRSDTFRLVAISIVSGMAWQTVIVSILDSRNFNEDMQATVKIADSLQSMNDIERPEDAQGKAAYRDAVRKELESVAMLARGMNTGAARNAVSDLLSTRLGHDFLSQGTPEVIDELNEIGISTDYSHLLRNAGDTDLILEPDTPLNVEGRDDGEVFIRTEIPWAGWYTIDVTSRDADRDLVAAVHGTENFELVAASDDSGDSLNPSVSTYFKSASYYLHVAGFLQPDLPGFTATLSRAPAGEEGDPEDEE